MKHVTISSVMLIVIISVGRVSTKAINTTVIKGITETSCDITPENATFPCTQYIIKNSHYCGDDELQQLFPDLYKVEDEAGMSWPGPVYNAKTITGQTNITWTGPQDGSIKYLKGYQIKEIGNSYLTFNMKYCTIFDLSRITKDDYNSLKNTVFTIQNTEMGNFQVTVKPLPFPPDNSIPLHTDILSPESSEYHPNLTYFVDDHQIDSNTVNISLRVDERDGEDAVDNIVVLVDNLDEKKRVDSIFFSIVKTYFVIGNLSTGTYRLQIYPKDDSEFGAVGDCICYEQTGTSRMCVPCLRHFKTFHIIDIYDPASMPDFSYLDPNPFVLG